MNPTPRGKTVLLVDDEQTILNLLTPIFKARYFEVLTATDGVEGLELFKSHRRDIVLLVSDIKMPGMSGIEMAASILELSPRLPVLIISGFRGAAFAMDSQSLLTRYALVEKPFSPIKLIEQAERLLAPRPSAPGSPEAGPTEPDGGDRQSANPNVVWKVRPGEGMIPP